mmetsp:Transcript_83813/g.233794  ORF Transcript_83813/g.233794 Transcript_83813/m.233794 type:complete len:480 (+) Transcript_83813:44-1483(+)
MVLETALAHEVPLCRTALLSFLMGAVACVAVVHDRVLDGTYLIVNKASGRKIFSSPRGFSATSGGTIHQEHRWHFIPQDNGTFTIVNAANGMRIFAQAGRDREEGFLTIDEGSIFQDQKWWPQLQFDGSYALVNARSGRRMAAHVGFNDATAFHAVVGHGPVGDDEMWWLINPDKDEVGHLLQKCRAEGPALLISSSSTGQGRCAGDGAAEAPTNMEPQELGVFYMGTGWPQGAQSQDISTAVIQAVFVSFVLAAFLFVFARRSWHAKIGARGARKEENDFATVVHDSQSDAVMFGSEITHRIFHADSDGGATRIVKIECPGVTHSDVEVGIIWNGCDVTISRQAALGVEATTWKKRFQFDPAEGLFEFKEDQMQLEQGFLHLVFRAYAFQRRAVRFPQHFSLASTDNDYCWDYSIESTSAEVSDAKIEGAGTASMSTASSPRQLARAAPTKTSGPSSRPPTSEDGDAGACGQHAHNAP